MPLSFSIIALAILLMVDLFVFIAITDLMNDLGEFQELLEIKSEHQIQTKKILTKRLDEYEEDLNYFLDRVNRLENQNATWNATRFMDDFN